MPTGTPALRRARAKWAMLSASLPSSGIGKSLKPVIVSDRAEFCTGFFEDAFGLGALQLGDVVLVFQQGAERVGDHLRGQLDRVQGDEAFGPVDGLGDAGFLEQIFVAQSLDEATTSRLSVSFASGARALRIASSRSKSG